MDSFHPHHQQPTPQVTAPPPPLVNASYSNNLPSLPPFPVPASSMGMNNHGCPPYQQPSMPPLPIPAMSSLPNGNQLLHQQHRVENIVNVAIRSPSTNGQQVVVTSNYAEPDVEEIIDDRDAEPIKPFYNDQSVFKYKQELDEGQQPPECNAPMYNMVDSSEDAVMANSSVYAVAAVDYDDGPSVTPVEHTVATEENIHEESLEEEAAAAADVDHSIQHVEQFIDVSMQEATVPSVDVQCAEQPTPAENVEQETLYNEPSDEPLNYPLIEDPESDAETHGEVGDNCSVAQEDEVCETVIETKEPYVEEPSEDDPIGEDSGMEEVDCEKSRKEEKEMEQTEETEPKEVLPIVDEDMKEIVEEAIEEPLTENVVGDEEEMNEKLNSEVIVDEVIDKTAENKDEQESPTCAEESNNSGDTADMKTTPKRKAKSDSPPVSSKKRVTISPLPPAVKQSIESPSGGRSQRNRTPVKSFIPVTPPKKDDTSKSSKSPTKKTPPSILKKSKVEKGTDKKGQAKKEKDEEHTKVTDTVSAPNDAIAEVIVSRTSRSRCWPKPGNMPERKSSREPKTKATSAASTSPAPIKNDRASKVKSVAKPTTQSKSRSQSSSTKSRSPAKGKQVAAEKTKVTKTATKNESASTKKRGRSAVTTSTRTAAVTEEAPKVREGSRRSSRKAALDAENSIAETLAPSAKRSKRS